MRILILGGTRFMGPTVARQLVAEAHEVAVFHRGETPGDLPPEVRHLTGDRRALRESQQQLRAFAPEVVLDMLAFNEREARDLLDVFRGAARRVIVASSQDVYRAYGRLLGTEPGPPDPTPLAEDAPLRERLYPFRGETPRAEDDPIRWRDDYDKIPVERIVLGDSALPGTVLRLPAVYGPSDHQHRVGQYLSRMDAGRSAIVLDEAIASWRWTRGYVEDIAAAIALAIADDRAAGQLYNVGEEHPLTVAEWISAIGQAAGWSGQIIALPRERLPSALVADMDTRQPFVSTSARIRRELGYAEHVSLEEALRRSVAWERAHPLPESDALAAELAAEDMVLATLE